jgi:hypothetical protein
VSPLVPSASLALFPARFRELWNQV